MNTTLHQNRWNNGVQKGRMELALCGGWFKGGEESEFCNSAYVMQQVLWQTRCPEGQKIWRPQTLWSRGEGSARLTCFMRRDPKDYYYIIDHVSSYCQITCEINRGEERENGRLVLQYVLPAFHDPGLTLQ